MRRACALLLLAAAASADLAGEVRACFRRDDPAERRARLHATRGVAGSADRRARNAAAAVIEKQLKKEAHPAVRQAAFDLLLALRTSRSLDRVAAAALDRDPLVREHIRLLVRDHADPMLHEAIVRALREDASWRMRCAMVDLLLAGSRASARPPLLEALADPHVAVRARAGEALERLTGKAFGVDADLWRKHFAENPERAEKKTGETVSVSTHRKVETHKGPVRGLVPTLYTIPIREKRVLFVVDMSSSMAKGTRSDHFVQLKDALFGLASDVSFNILCFDQRMFFFTEAKSLVPATTAAKDDAARWIDALPAGQRTDVHRSVASGLAMLKEALYADETARAELFILTDGRETARSMSITAVESQYKKLPVERCRIHVVSLGRAGTPALRRLAEASGGIFKEAPGR